MSSAPTVILATGLGQGKISNGMNRVRKRIWAACPEADVRVVSYKQYEEMIPELAAELIQSGAEIIGGAHSFGAWWWTLLAKELGDYPVRCLCFADGVGRHPLHSPLVVRPNVQEFHSWRQTRGIIKGSPLAVVRQSETNWATNETVNVLHPFVDEVQGFQDALAAAVIAAARGK